MALTGVPRGLPSNTGTSKAVIGVPRGSTNTNTEQPKQSTLGKVGSFVGDIAKDAFNTLLVTPAARTTEAITRTVFPNSLAAKGYEAMADEGQSQKLLGVDVAPVKAFGQGGGKQIAGEALSTASWLIGGGGAKTASSVFKQGVKQFAKTQGTKLVWEGAAIGLTGSLGSQLKDDAQNGTPVSLKKTLTDTVLSTALTPVAAFGLNRLFGKKLPELLKTKNLDGLMNNDKWAVITGTREKVGTFNQSINVSANKRLEEELVAKYGKENVVKVEGKYNNVNKGDSYFVNGIDEPTAQAYGKKYGQDTVLTKKGFVASDGSFYEPATGITTGKDALNKPGYSTLPNGQTMAMDIGNRVDTPKPAIPMSGDVVKQLPAPKPTLPAPIALGGKVYGGEVTVKQASKNPVTINPKTGKFQTTYNSGGETISSKTIESTVPGGKITTPTTVKMNTNIPETTTAIVPTVKNTTRIPKGTVVTKGANDINNKIISNGVDSLASEDLAKYNPVVIADNKEIISKSYAENPIETMNAAITGKNIPKGANGELLLKAMSDIADKEGNTEAQMALADSPLFSKESTAAQTLRLAQEYGNPESGVELIRKNNRSIAAAFEKKNGIKLEEAVKKEVKTALEKKPKLSLKDFISQIKEC